jgi:hypothetical protein
MRSQTLFNQIIGPVRPDAAPDVAIRAAGPADEAALTELAQLDSSRAPRGHVLVAEAGGGIRAALSVDDRHAVSDPFWPSGDLLSLLRERARQLDRPARGRQRLAFRLA